jgi:hypothetical protein
MKRDKLRVKASFRELALRNPGYEKRVSKEK